MQGTTHRSSSLNDTATSSPVSLQEAATQKVKVIRAFWIHNTSRSHDHSTPRSFLLVATTTSMQQSLSNASITLIFSHSFQLHLFIPFPCFSFHSFHSFHSIPLSESCASISYSRLQATNTIKRYSKGF